MQDQTRLSRTGTARAAAPPRSATRSVAALAWLVASGLACAAPPPSPSPAEGGAEASATQQQQQKAPLPVPTQAPASPGGTGAAAASAAPTAPDASASPAGAAPGESPAPSATAAAEAPIPNVKVVNIGMHVGGGENDASEKAPIKRSVEPHFDSFKRCFGLAEDQKKGGDFGVDIAIDRAGGRAKISHPRTAIKGAAFKDCMVKAFEEIDFLKPKGGKATTVSYSVRFTPQGG